MPMSETRELRKHALQQDIIPSKMFEVQAERLKQMLLAK